MSLVSEQKQQHYVPKCYSKNFTDPRGYLNLLDFDTNKAFSLLPCNALKQGYLYRQPVHDEGRFDNSLENFFSRTVEARWPDIVRSIERKETFSPEQWSDFLEFMISMRVRVLNSMNSVISLLKAKVIEASPLVAEEPPAVLVEQFREHNPDHFGAITLHDLLASGVIQANIDPHSAILSLHNLIISVDRDLNRISAPRFIHNETDIDFISSDNPVIYHVKKPVYEEQSPYSFSPKLPMEFIFPITPRIAFLFDTRRNNVGRHTSTFSRKTVSRINGHVTRYSDRYAFARSPSDLEGLDIISPRQRPIPNLQKSIVGNGFVNRIGYDFGFVPRTTNTWRYQFEAG